MIKSLKDVLINSSQDCMLGSQNQNTIGEDKTHNKMTEKKYKQTRVQTAFRVAREENTIRGDKQNKKMTKVPIV